MADGVLCASSHMFPYVRVGYEVLNNSFTSHISCWIYMFVHLRPYTFECVCVCSNMYHTVCACDRGDDSCRGRTVCLARSRSRVLLCGRLYDLGRFVAFDIHTHIHTGEHSLTRDDHEWQTIASVVDDDHNRSIHTCDGAFSERVLVTCELTNIQCCVLCSALTIHC